MKYIKTFENFKPIKINSHKPFKIKPNLQKSIIVLQEDIKALRRTLENEKNFKKRSEINKKINTYIKKLKDLIFYKLKQAEYLKNNPIVESYEEDYDPYEAVIGYGRYITFFKLDFIEPTLRGLMRDNIDFDFYYHESEPVSSSLREKGKLVDYLILLKDKNQLKEKNILPSTEDDKWYISPITRYDFEGTDWIKVDNIELFLDTNKYNL